MSFNILILQNIKSRLKNIMRYISPKILYPPLLIFIPIEEGVRIINIMAVKI